MMTNVPRMILISLLNDLFDIIQIKSENKSLELFIEFPV